MEADTTSEAVGGIVQTLSQYGMKKKKRRGRCVSPVQTWYAINLHLRLFK